jgi:AbrB family looped-hinge helix DNA binding protein
VKTVVSSKGQVVLPAELRQRDRILPGQRFDVERLDEGRYLLTKVDSESTDTL